MTKTNDRDRTDEKLHKFIHITKQNRIGLVDTKVGGNLLISNNTTTNTLFANKIGLDDSLDVSGYAGFLDVSTTKLTVFGDAIVTGVLHVNNVLRKTLTDIDITGDLSLDNKLDVSGLFTTHGGVNILGNNTSDKINNVTIGYDVSGKGSFTDLSSTNLTVANLNIHTLDNCNIGDNGKATGSFSDVSCTNLSVGTNTLSGVISSYNTNSLILQTGLNNEGNGNINTGTIELINGIDGNFIMLPNGNGEVVISKIDVSGGKADSVDLTNSSLTVTNGKTLDVSNGTLILSGAQKSNILKDGGLYNNSNIDIGNFDLRAQTLTADSLAQNKVIYTGANGLLSVQSGFEYNPNTDLLSVGNISQFTANGPIDFNSQDLSNLKINNGNIRGTTIKTSDITVGSGKTLDVQNGTLTTSISQNLNILHNSTANNNQDIDIQGYGFRAANLTADSLNQGSVIFTGTNGLLSAESTFAYNTSSNLLTVDKISGFQAEGAINFNDQSASNMNLHQGTVGFCDIFESNITVSQNKILDTTAGTLTTSNAQDVSILQNGASNNNADIDIQNYNLRASTLTADSLTTGQIVYTGDNGILSAESGFEYNTTANTMTVQNFTCAGLFTLSQSSNSITANITIDITKTKSALITTTSNYTFSLPDGAEGQIIFAYLKTKGGTNGAEIIPSNFHNGTKVTLDTVGENATLMFIDNKWIVTSTYGGIVT